MHRGPLPPCEVLGCERPERRDDGLQPPLGEGFEELDHQRFPGVVEQRRQVLGPGGCPVARQSQTADRLGERLSARALSGALDGLVGDVGRPGPDALGLRLRDQPGDDLVHDLPLALACPPPRRLVSATMQGAGAATDMPFPPAAGDGEPA